MILNIFSFWILEHNDIITNANIEQKQVYYIFNTIYLEIIPNNHRILYRILQVIPTESLRCHTYTSIYLSPSN